MADRNPPWFQAEPFPAIVRVLLDHGVLREGGTVSLKLAARIAASSTRDVKDRQAAIVDALTREGLVPGSPYGVAADAADDVLAVLVAHEAT